MLRLRGGRVLVALLLAFLIGDQLLFFMLKGRIWALQLVHRDTTGAAFEATPDPDMETQAAGLRFDYRMGMDSTRAELVGAPARTGEDGGLEDLRRDMVWVRDRLRAGEGYATTRWRLEDAVAAAAADSGRRFLCFSYSCAMVSLAQAQGYAARVVHLGRHITSEVYLPDRGRWVVADALYDFIPFDLRGEPLSLLETHRRLASGAAVEWRPVHGVNGDDDQLDGSTRPVVESLVRAGDFVTMDGPLTFSLLTDLGRVRDVVTGRPRVLQLALRGQPALDKAERGLRRAFVLWNALALLVLAGWLWFGRRPRSLPA